MATIKFPLYLKSDCGVVYTKVISPFEVIDVAASENNAFVHRVKSTEFTGSYRSYLSDQAMYSNEEEFNEKYRMAKMIIEPHFFSFVNAVHLN